MHLTWKDGLATVFVGAAVALYARWLGGATVALWVITTIRHATHRPIGVP